MQRMPQDPEVHGGFKPRLAGEMRKVCRVPGAGSIYIGRLSSEPRRASGVSRSQGYGQGVRDRFGSTGCYRRLCHILLFDISILIFHFTRAVPTSSPPVKEKAG